MPRQVKKVKHVCSHCRDGRCDLCMDVSRALLGLTLRCECTRKGHLGEPHGAPGHECDDLCSALNDGRTFVFDDEPEPEPKPDPCTKCGGSGSWPHPTRQVCPRCGATGAEPPYERGITFDGTV